jgi:hypothetical protein
MPRIVGSRSRNDNDHGDVLSEVGAAHSPRVQIAFANLILEAIATRRAESRPSRGPELSMRRIEGRIYT